MAESLIQRTRALLEKDSRRLSVLSRETGLPYYWLRNFKLGVSKQPGVNRLEKLYAALNPEK